MRTTSRFAPVRSLLQAQVEAGRMPGFVVALRQGGDTEIRTGGTMAVPPSRPMQPDSLFRLASVSKIFAGALTLSLVQDGLLGLDAAVSEWLPELSAPQVLTDRQGELTDTVPARRPVTVRHLLTNTAGFGGLWEPCPLQQAMAARGIAPGPLPPAMSPDEFMARLGELPLALHPGSGWLYHTSTDVLSVLLARRTGRTVDQLLTERICAPLGLRSTGFVADDPTALATMYRPDEYRPDDSRLRVFDPPGSGFARRPDFESLGAGLVSTAGDVLALLNALADDGGAILRPETADLLRNDALDATTRASAQEFLGTGTSWGMQVAVTLERRSSWTTPGRFGWDGGSGTSAWADPANDLAAVLLTQRMMTGPRDTPDVFWETVYGCLPAAGPR